MQNARWQFAIDVGGTFTDVVARSPDGVPRTHKVLSSGQTRGVARIVGRDRLIDANRCGDPDGFWVGYELTVGTHCAAVTAFDPGQGELVFEPPLTDAIDGETAYGLFGGEASPILAIRHLLGLGLHNPIESIDLRLGSTRSTNALLERKGAPTAFITTSGFGDILAIANQDRPKLFDLNIRKPEQLACVRIELNERIAADGSVIQPLDEDAARRQLATLHRQGEYSLAICLLNAYANPAHESAVARIARELGFAHVSASHEVSPLQRIVSRGDTTVVDAYLAPVIRDYLAEIGRALPGSSFRLMTSAGGLVGAERVSAKDTLLSGPAGGVVGFARVAELAGFDRSIGFDMGGTSTDVCRYDRGFDYQFETVKGGVRIVAPMMAIETVAAGGGSICAFDGQMLTVGPESAGAAPGPACYGAGGPLALTDVNVFLGRIPPEHFPFPLDVVASRARLEAVRDEVRSNTGNDIDPIELAEGFLRIANESMAAAIRRISTEKGYDPADYVLVAFGGAGGQHACAVASLIGVSRVLTTSLAGVLSAYGISVADVKRFAERPVRMTCDERANAACDTLFAEMEAPLRIEIRGEGIPDESIEPPTRLLDIRYVGGDACITVPAGGNPRERFEQMHEQLYGYIHAGRPVEIVALRVDIVGRTPTPAANRQKPEPRCPQARATTDVTFSGTTRPTPVYHRDELHAGDSIDGPAIILESTSTTVIEPAWKAEVLACGSLLLTTPPRTETAHANADASTTADPIRLELFRNRFAAIAERMGTTLQRTAMSTNVKERLDFSCAIFNANGDLVVNAPHVPVHLGSMADAVKAARVDVPDLEPGDVVLGNDPSRGGTHLPDLTCVTPVFDEDGASILFYVASRAHHAEIGSPQPGSMPADSKRLADEGVLIRNFKVVRSGEFQVDELQALLTGGEHPSRAPQENIADITAQIAANRLGIHELQNLIVTAGREVVLAYADHIQAAAEQKMRAALARIPDGEYSFLDQMDDGSTIAVSITVRGDRATIDFTGTSGVNPGNFNANRAIVTSAVLYCFRCLIAENIPLNAGVLAPLEIILPEGMLNPPASIDPRERPAVAAGNVETSQRIVDVIFGALGTVAASQGTMNNFIFGNERFGCYETICGGAGAGPDFDGADAVHTHMTNTRQTDPEVLESRYPVRLRRFEIRCGSGGDGRCRGGDGVIREFEFLAPLEVSIISQRRTAGPYGLADGHPGKPGQNLLLRAGSNAPADLGPVARFTVSPGDRVIIETPGGGGYGSP